MQLSDETQATASAVLRPSTILQRRGQMQLDCRVQPRWGGTTEQSEHSGDEFLGTGSTPTPSPPLLQRRPRKGRARLTLNCSAILTEERSTPSMIHPESASSRLKEYETKEILGQGTAGVVRRARRKCDGQEVALKIVRTLDPELSTSTCREFDLLKTLSHPHIIRGHDSIPLNSCVVLVLEYFPGATLQDTVRRVPGRRIPEDRARDLFAALMSAIAYLHEKQILHRDVKAANVLVSDNLSDLRLIDFNTAQQVEDGGALSMTGTREWSAPEVLRGESPGYPQDVWGAGLCLFVMLCGRLPQPASRCCSAEEYAAAITAAIGLALHGKRLELLSEPCHEALRCCLEEDTPRRPEAQAVVRTSRWLAAEGGAADRPCCRRVLGYGQ